jgi:hypothetical protein
MLTGIVLTSLSLRSGISFVGPLIGPIMAGFASIELGWRAVFWRVNTLFGFPFSVIVADLSSPQGLRSHSPWLPLYLFS